MPLFPEKLGVTIDCPKCGKPTPYEKIGTNRALHALLTFFTFMLWAPVFVVSVLLDNRRPYRCAACSNAMSVAEVEAKQNKPRQS